MDRRATLALLVHWGRLYLRILAASLTCMGRRGPRWFVYYALRYPLRSAYVVSSLALDAALFPRCRDTALREPILLIGHPRSGTTFLRSLLADADGVTAFRRVEIENPALVVRKGLRRYPWLQRLLTARLDPQSAASGSAATSVDPQALALSEEELLSHILDTQFVSLGSPLGFTRRGYPEVVFQGGQKHQAAAFAFLRACLQRQALWSGAARVVAKLNWSIFRLPELLDAFADARVILVVRDPVDAICSHLSLHRRILHNNFGGQLSEDARRRYLEHRYEYDVAYYRQMERLASSGDLEDPRVLLVSYESLCDDLPAVLERVRRHAGVTWTAAADRIRRAIDEQPTHRRPHTNQPLAAFGLSEEQVRSDTGDVVRRLRERCASVG